MQTQPEPPRPAAVSAITCEGFSPRWTTARTISARMLDMAVLPVAPEQVAVVWEQVLLKVKDHLASPQAFDTWFRPIVARELTPQQVDLEVPNAFFVDWIHEHHLTTLRRALADILGRCPDLRFSPREPVPVPPLVPARTPTAARPTPAPALEWLDHQPPPPLTFEAFLGGASTRFTPPPPMAVSQ